MISIPSFLLGGFSIGALFTLLAFYYATNPHKLEKAIAVVMWLASTVWRQGEKIAIKNEVQGKINSFVSNLEANSDIEYARVSIRFANQDSTDLAYEDGAAIIVMRDRGHRNKNFVYAAHFFASSTLLSRTKNHLSKTLNQSITLYTTKKIIEEESVQALKQYMSDYFVPLLEKGELKEIIGKYEHIDQKGLYLPVLLQELSYIGQKIYIDTPKEEIIKEVKLLIEYLERYSKRKVGDSTSQDTFLGKYTRCTIKVVSSQASREQGKTSMHVERITNAIKQSVENIYLLGHVLKENKNFMETVCSQVLEKHPNIVRMKADTVKGRIFSRELRMRRVDTYFIHLQNPEAIRPIILEEEVRQITE